MTSVPTHALARPTDDFHLPGVPDIRDPYPFLAAAADREPVTHVGEMDISALGRRDAYIVYGYQDCVEVLRNGQTFTTAPMHDIVGPAMGRTILEMAGDEHRAHRGIVAHAFRPKVLARWTDEVIVPAAHEVIDRFVDAKRADLVADFTFHFPAQVIARLLGLPRSDIARFQRWATAIIAVAARPTDGVAAAAEVREYLAPFIAARRTAPEDDLISELVTAQFEGRALTDEEIHPFLLLLLPAGVETTYRGIGNLMVALLTHTDQLDAVLADRSRVVDAVEEALRWEPPIPMLTRECDHATQVHGVDVPGRALMNVCTGMANRDASQWANPHAYDLDRSHKQNLTFGFGAHMCLGAHLARIEMRVALDALLGRLPGLRLHPDADDVHIHGMAFRSPISLPVVWD